MSSASNQPADTSGIIRDDTGTDGAVAGPSGINTRQLVSSTPNIQSTAAHLLVGTERKMNGMKTFFNMMYKRFYYLLKIT
jgi:hypothetical protein